MQAWRRFGLAAAAVGILAGSLALCALETRHRLLSPAEIAEWHHLTAESIRGSSDVAFDTFDPTLDATRSGATSAPLNRFVAGLISFSVRKAGISAFSLRLPAFLAISVLLLTVFLFVRQRAPAVAALWAVLMVLSTELARSAFDARAAALEGAVVALALLSWQVLSGQWRPWWLIPLAASLGFAVWFDARAGFVALVLLVATGIDAANSRRLETMVAAILCAAAVVVAVVTGGAVPAIAHAVSRTIDAPVLAGKQPVYALAFLQSTYGRIFGLVTPFFLLLMGGTAAFAATGTPKTAHADGVDVQAEDGAVSQPPIRERPVVRALALMPVWAFAPAWMIRRDVPGVALWFVVIGVAVWLAFSGARLVATRSRAIKTVWTLGLLAAAASNLMLRDPMAFSTADLSSHRGRFVLIDWAGRLDASLPIVVPDRAVYLQLAHYAPQDVAERLVHQSTERGFAAFLTGRRSFYVFEAAEVRSPVFAWMAAWNPRLSEARSWTPKDLSLEAPAFLYRVDIPASSSGRPGSLR